MSTIAENYDNDCKLIKEINLNNFVIKCMIRNNQWKKTNKVFDIIEKTKKIICPYGHIKEITKLFKEGKFNNERYSQIFINDLNIGDIVLVFDREEKEGLLVKIKSNPNGEMLKDIIILRKHIC